MVFNRNPSLPSLFADASMLGHGGFCRTGSLIFSYTSSITEAWLELQETGVNKWLVRKVSYELADLLDMDATQAEAITATEDDKRAINRPTISRQITVSKDVSLFEGLKTLAQFEISSLAAGQAIRGKDTPQSLDDAHYIAFGLGNMIAFDEDTGAPCETIEGRIVANGHFTDATRDAVMNAWKKKQQNPSSDIVDTLFAKGNINVRAFTAFLKTVDEFGTAKSLSDNYSTVYFALKECLDYNFQYSSDIESFENKVKAFRNSERHYPDQIRPFIAKSATLFQIVFDIERKKSSIKNSMDSAKPHDDFSKTFSNVFRSVQESLKQEGLDLEAASIIKTLLSNPIDDHPQMPKPFDDCRQVLNRRAQDLKKQSETLRLQTIS